MQKYQIPISLLRQYKNYCESWVTMYLVLCTLGTEKTHTLKLSHIGLSCYPIPIRYIISLLILFFTSAHLSFLPSSSLKHSRNQSVRHSVCVSLPVLAVFAAAAVLVTHTAVDQEDGHVNNIEVGQNVTKATGSTVRQRAHQVTGVVEVAGHTPEARGEELAAVEATVCGTVRALNVLGLTAPDGAGALCATEQVLLVVGGTEDVIPDEAEQQDSHSMGGGKLDRVVHQV